MVQLEHLMRWTIIACLIVFVGYVICWLIQIRMNKNVIKCLEENIKARKDYEKAANELLKLLKEAYGNICEWHNEVAASVNQMYLNLADEITKLRRPRTVLHPIVKDEHNANSSENEGVRNPIQWAEGDRPRRKYTRRNNASKNS